MKWISVEDKIPPREEDSIIVAIMRVRKEFGNDPVQDGRIVILRCHCEQWMTMDVIERFYSPDEEERPEGDGCWTKEIMFWVPWYDFDFPEEMICR